jgi:HAD superfamily hydrolase (TIGR01509 family)
MACWSTRCPRISWPSSAWASAWACRSPATCSIARWGSITLRSSRSVAIEALQPIPGSIDLVRALHDAGMPLAVGSSGPRDNVALALAKLGILQYFGAVVTGDDVTRGKPAPDIFLLAAARLRVDPWTCVVIEDAEQGVEAALAAGMRVVAVTTSLPAERLRKATRVVASLRDLTPTDLLAPDQPLPTHPT